MIEDTLNNGMKQGGVSLRPATQEDSAFIFKAQYEGMRPVREIHDSKGVDDEEERFAAHAASFDPEKIQVIQYQGQDVGRLRVVRSSESIYVGGIQILPEFQGKGIGTAIFKELIDESNRTDLPIVLEVHDVNERAMAFYENLGFSRGEKVKDQTVMTYAPARGKVAAP